MTKRFTDGKTSLIVLAACLVMYFFVYIGRINFTVTIVNAVSGNIMTKTQCGLINSLFYLSYGAGQFIFGFLGDKRSPFKMIFIGILGSGAANMAIFFSNSFWPILIFFFANGFLQSMIFPPMVEIFSSYLKKGHGGFGIKYMCVVYPLGVIVANALVILFTKFWNYKMIFLFSSVTLFIIAALWMLVSKRAVKSLSEINGRPEEAQNQPAPPAKSLNVFIGAGIIFIGLVVLCRGFLDSGVNSWVPTMISETYSLSPSKSQLFTMFLPLANIAGIIISAHVYRWLKNEMLSVLIFFIIILFPLIGLIFIEDTGIALNIVLLAVINMCLYVFMQNLMMKIPSNFSAYGKASAATGILNGVSAVGYVLGNPLFGAVAEQYSWKVIAVLWTAIAALGVLFCLLSLKRWSKFKRENKD